MSQIKNIWNVGATVYDEQLKNCLPYHRSHEVIVDLVSKAGSSVCLDVGSGTGVVAEKILKAIPTIKVTCIDFSSHMIEESKRRLAPFASRVEFVCADFSEWNAEKKYDAIITCNAFIYNESKVDDCYSKFANCLMPGGLFLNSTIIEYEFANLPEFTKKLFLPISSSKEVIDFREGTGKKISYYGADSLLVPIPIHKHIDFMTSAGLKSMCIWQYVYQAVIMGIKNV